MQHWKLTMSFCYEKIALSLKASPSIIETKCYQTDQTWRLRLATKSHFSTSHSLDLVGCRCVILHSLYFCDWCVCCLWLKAWLVNVWIICCQLGFCLLMLLRYTHVAAMLAFVVIGRSEPNYLRIGSFPLVKSIDWEIWCV